MKENAVINRLRTGHTLLSHGYLMSSEPVPPCELCPNATMSVKHLIEYLNLNYFRIEFLDRCSPLELKNLLDDCQISNNFILFLKESGICNRVRTDSLTRLALNKSI